MSSQPTAQLELREFVGALIGGTYVEWWDGRLARSSLSDLYRMELKVGVVPAVDRDEVDPFTTRARGAPTDPNIVLLLDHSVNTSVLR